jgi:hypothetical protein
MIKRKRGRPFKENKIKKPVVGGQVEQAELDAINELQRRTGRSQSYLVRLAMVRLLNDDLIGGVDWERGIPEIGSNGIVKVVSNES